MSLQVVFSLNLSGAFKPCLFSVDSTLSSAFCTQASASVVLPLAGGDCNVHVSLVPGEKAGEGDGAIVLHGTGQHVKLRTSGTHQGAGTPDVDEQPLLDEVLGVVWQQRTLAEELHSALDAKLRLPCWDAMAVKLGGHGCVRGRRKQTINNLESQSNWKM